VFAVIRGAIGEIWRKMSPLFIPFLRIAVTTSLLFPLFPLSIPPNISISPPNDPALELLETMTPEERVGQLVIVSFQGSTAEEGSAIYQLIVQNHIGGVLLDPAHDNFVDAPQTLDAVHSLIRALQDIEYQGSLLDSLTDPDTGLSRQPAYVPLFIAMESDAMEFKHGRMLLGMTEFPSQMALGATWDTSLAQRVGETLGRELEVIGVNMVLGPSLDVLEDPRLGETGLGVSSFGGDPFWVSLMGQAYISGVHQGSGGRVAVIAKHFPGLGASDRPLELEVATIRKSLEELKQIDLVPFFAVAGAGPGEETNITDGLLMSHIRYQGLQGNIRATTKPVSLDQQAFSALMALEPLSAWREGGGLTVSDSLGSRAVRRFYDPLERTFSGPMVARNAFLAGNDLLLLSNFRSSTDPDELTTLQATLDSFVRKYQDDAVFAQRVDEAVLRILRLKGRLYEMPFHQVRIGPNEENWSSIGKGTETIYEVARQAATLISPSYEELDERLGGPPAIGEQIVFFTDVRTYQQCSTCQEIPVIGTDDFQNAVLRLYGPQATGQVGGWALDSFDLADLAYYLSGELPDETGIIKRGVDEVDEALRSADWLVFAVLRESGDAYGSDGLKLLLDRRPDIARFKRLVVFNFDVPYELDATDISKIDAQFALYDSSQAFIDVAAGLLFEELRPMGAPPVTIPGIGYDLMDALAPAADQILSLRLSPAETSEGTPKPEVGFKVGDVVLIETGTIRDTNGNPVPDGTPVTFRLSYQGETTPALQLEVFSVNGTARTSKTLDRIGLLIIEAESGSAKTSERIELNVQEGELAYATVIAPTEAPQASAAPTSPIPVQTPPPEGGEEGEPSDAGASNKPGAVELFLSLMTTAGIAGAYVFWGRKNERPRRVLVRVGIAGVIGALLAYDYLALQLPGSVWLMQNLGLVAGPLLALGGALLGICLAYLVATRMQRAR
jgi:beta-N-acetylhexosaminidase